MTSIWFIATIVLIFVELLVTTFVFLPFAVGTFFAGLVSLITDNQNAQLTTFVIFSIVGVYLSVKVFGPRRKSSESSGYFNEGAYKYIGKSFIATKELDPYSSTIQHVYGDDWQVVSKERRIPEGTLVSITNVSGVKLEVEEVKG
jgi:membrane protein implicated in regulation of membrane protease activity